ncbi:MAG: hypothetical protein SPH18_06865, partial [Sutterella parvirubra]|nr:hypothetical protein [Sutterella parvirubra]
PRAEAERFAQVPPEVGETERPRPISFALSDERRIPGVAVNDKILRVALNGAKTGEILENRRSTDVKGFDEG